MPVAMCRLPRRRGTASFMLPACMPALHRRADVAPAGCRGGAPRPPICRKSRTGRGGRHGRARDDWAISPASCLHQRLIDSAGQWAVRPAAADNGSLVRKNRAAGLSPAPLPLGAIFRAAEGGGASCRQPSGATSARARIRAQMRSSTAPHPWRGCRSFRELTWPDRGHVSQQERFP